MKLFWHFAPWYWKVRELQKKNAPGILKNNEKQPQILQTLVFIQIIGKQIWNISLWQTDPKQYKPNGYIPEVHSELCQTS